MLRHVAAVAPEGRWPSSVGQQYQAALADVVAAAPAALDALSHHIAARARSRPAAGWFPLSRAPASRWGGVRHNRIKHRLG